MVRARKLGRRAARIESGRFLAEGPQAVREALASGLVLEVFVTPEGEHRHPDLVQLALERGQQLLDVDEKTFSSLCDTVNPQGLAAVARIPQVTLADAIGEHARLVVVLVEARDPGNVGTIIRIADAAGADAVVLTADSVDPFNAKSVRASAGSIFHLPVACGISLADLSGQLREVGLATVAAAGEADRSVFDPSVTALLANPMAWLFGNEAHGLSQPALDLCSITLRVPIYGGAESLNLAAAAAVCIYASATAQRSPFR
ncbi:MAG: RNA methyltransferase [Actinomycetes bacterium]